MPFKKQLRQNIFSRFISPAALLLSIVACGGGGGGTEPPPPPPPPPSACGVEVAGTSCKPLTITGQSERGYLIYEPSSRRDLAPVVIMLHGDPGTVATIENYLDGKTFADDNGYVLAVPAGQGSFAWSSQVNASADLSRDSVFIGAIIDDLVANHQVDADNIFVAGYSAGGFMVYQLACEIPERITAAVAISGQFRGSLDECNAPSPMAIHHIHGTNDADVPASGRADGIATVDATLEMWQSVNNCDATTAQSASFVITADNKSATTETYDNCASALEYTEVTSGVHEQNYNLEVLHSLMRDFFEPPQAR